MSLLRKKHNKPEFKELYCISDDNAPFYYVEAYKMLCTNIEFITAAEKCKNIMITSTLANEGKTNVSINLALTLSGYGKKVCLVECDFRRPSIHRFIVTKHNTNGLTNVLKGEIEIDKAIRKVSGTDMSILLSGTCPPNPSELLASDKMKAVIDQLGQDYDYIIYDTPPVLLVTDAAALGKYIDGTIFVVRHNSTEKNLVLKAKKNLENAGVKIIGAIYSAFSEKNAGSYSSDYSYSYKYYYGSDKEKKDD